MKIEKTITVLNYVAWCLLALSIIMTVVLLNDVGVALTVGFIGCITSLLLFALANIVEALNVSAHNSSIIAEELIKVNENR